MTSPGQNTSVQRVVVLLDPDTPAAERQLGWATWLAQRWQAPLTLLTVVMPSRTSLPMDVATAIAQDYLSLVALALQESEDAMPIITTEVREGLVDEEWKEYSRQHPGSVLFHADIAALGQLTTPVIVVPEQASAPEELRRVIVGTDGDSLSEAVLAITRTTTPAPIEVVEVEAIERGYLPDHQFVQLQPVVTDSRVSVRGKAGSVILTVARLRQGQMIVVGAHGRGGSLLRMLTGSTSQWLAANSDIPVVVVPEAWVTSSAG